MTEPLGNRMLSSRLFLSATLICGILVYPAEGLPGSLRRPDAAYADSGHIGTAGNSIESKAFLDMKQALDTAQWSALKSAIHSELASFEKLTPEAKLNATQSLVRFAQILIKANRTEEGLMILNSISVLLSALPAKMETAELFVETASLLQTIGMPADAKRMTDVARMLASKSNTWKSDKESLSMECERIERDIQTSARDVPTGKMDIPKQNVSKDTRGYRFNYVALASSSGVFRGNTSSGYKKVASLIPRSTNQGSFVGSYGYFENRNGSARKFENFNWAYNIPWNTSPLEAGAIYGAVPPNPMTLPFPPGPTAPPGATTLDASRIGRGIEPGDYVVSKLWTRVLTISQPGKVRIFIQGDKLSEGPCFWAEVNSQINSPFSLNTVHPDLEIWYNGYGTLKLDHNCRMEGIIYAPNARVELGPNNVDFAGAIVARTICADGNVTLDLTDAVLHWH